MTERHTFTLSSGELVSQANSCSGFFGKPVLWGAERKGQKVHWEGKV